MSENLHLVFSKPPEAISDEEYNRWYDFHLGEILVVPGFVSARRYRLQTVKGEWTPSGHRYLSAYEIEGDPRDVMRELEQEGVIGELCDEFISTSGLANPLSNTRRMGREPRVLRVASCGVCPAVGREQGTELSGEERC